MSSQRVFAGALRRVLWNLPLVPIAVEVCTYSRLSSVHPLEADLESPQSLGRDPRVLGGGLSLSLAPAWPRSLAFSESAFPCVTWAAGIPVASAPFTAGIPGLQIRFPEESSGAPSTFPWGKLRATLMPRLPHEVQRRWPGGPRVPAVSQVESMVVKSSLAQKEETLSVWRAGGYTCRSLKAKPVGLQMREGVQLCHFVEVQKDQVPFVWGKSLTLSLRPGKHFFPSLT